LAMGRTCEKSWNCVRFYFLAPSEVDSLMPFPRQRADASIYLKEGQRDCSVTPNITGCAVKH
jgi:hypothetical protein